MQEAGVVLGNLFLLEPDTWLFKINGHAKGIEISFLLTRVAKWGSIRNSCIRLKICLLLTDPTGRHVTVLHADHQLFKPRTFITKATTCAPWAKNIVLLTGSNSRQLSSSELATRMEHCFPVSYGSPRTSIELMWKGGIFPPREKQTMYGRNLPSF